MGNGNTRWIECSALALATFIPSRKAPGLFGLENTWSLQSRYATTVDTCLLSLLTQSTCSA